MKVIILGVGAQAKYIVETFKLLNVEVIGLLDTSSNGKGSVRKIDNIKVIGGLELLDKFKKDKAVRLIVANSSNKEKENLVKRMNKFNFKFTNAIHPSAVIATTARIEKNVIINAGAVIQPFAKIGSGVMVHAGVIVEHDCNIEDYVNLGPGATLAGWVHVKEGSYVYTNASVIPRIVIGKKSIVGAGSVVLRDVPDGLTVAGNPAKVVKKER